MIDGVPENIPNSDVDNQDKESKININLTAMSEKNKIRWKICPFSKKDFLNSD